MLTDSQRAELHASIVGYLRSRGVDSDLVAQLSAALSVTSPTDLLLERKWAALVRMQRKVLELEQSNAALQTELKAAKLAAPADGKIAAYLPKYPPRYVLEGHRASVLSVSFHPKYALVASGSEDGSIKVWDYEQGEIDRTLKAHTRAVNGLGFAPLSGHLVSCSADLSIKVFNHEFQNTRTLLGHDHTVSGLAVFATGNREYVASCSRDKTVRIWELSTGFVLDVLRHHTDWVRCVDAVCIDGVPYILSGGSDRVVTLSAWEGGAEDNGGGARGGLSGAHKYAAHKHVIECCRFAPASSHRFIAKQFPELAESDICFASAGRDNLIHVWSSRRKEAPIMTLAGHDNWVQSLAFHPLGRFLVSVGDDKTMRIWDLANARLVKTIPAHDHFVSCVAWHNTAVATGSVDQSVKIW